MFVIDDCTLEMTGTSVIRGNHGKSGGGGVTVVYGTAIGARCAPNPQANVYDNTPDDCSGVPESP